MDFTVYLPDALGERAKAEPNLNLSRMLRDALQEELDRRDQMTDTLKNVGTHTVPLENDSGAYYTGRITGALVYNDGRVEVFITDDERVIVYDLGELKHHVLQDPEEELRNTLDEDSYSTVMEALGISPVIDL